MKNPQKGSTSVVLLVTIILILLGVIAWIYLSKSTQVNQIHDSNEPKVDQMVSVVTKPVLTPSITITSPNGGELLSQNTSYVITWKYSELKNDDPVTIGFRTPSENVCWIGKSVAGSKEYSFVPSQVKCEESASNLKSGGKFKAQLIVDKYANGRGVADMSDGYFTVATQ